LAILSFAIKSVFAGKPVFSFISQLRAMLFSVSRDVGLLYKAALNTFSVLAQKFNQTI